MQKHISRQFLVIPGRRHGPLSWSMRRVARALGKDGSDVRIARVRWRGRTITDWLEEIDQDLAMFYMPRTTIVGFHEGALLATHIASRQTPERLALHSMPALWSEDIRRYGASWFLRVVRPERLRAYRAYAFADIAPTIMSPTVIVVRRREMQRASPRFQRAKLAHQLIDNSELRIVPRGSGKVSEILPNLKVGHTVKAA